MPEGKVAGMDPEKQLQARIRLARLFDLYSGLLTERQRKAFELHELSDLSLQEVADNLGGTRQGAGDLLQRARLRLVELESALGLLDRLDALAGRIRSVLGRYPAELPPPFLQEMEAALGLAEEAEEQDV